MRIMSLLLAAALCAAVPAAASPSSSASAKPKVVVSLPPLHSLVSRLLQGVAEPELLMDQRLDTRLVDLNGRQVEALRRADLMIWSGPALEGAIAEAGMVMPDLAGRSLTLSRHVPLMSPAAEGSDQTGGPRDLRFWLDPRLAHHAVHMIAPALVRVYPEATEAILDNEIALMAELHHAEHATRAALGTAWGTPLHVGSGDLRYLEWRFNLAKSGCARGGFDPLGFNLPAGAALYGKMMDGARQALAACVGGKPERRAPSADL